LIGFTVNMNRKGVKNPMYGKHLTEETKKKISESLLGPKNPNFGKIISDEARRLISLKNKGRPAWNKGIHPSDASRNKMSISHMGIHHSAETLAKRSLALAGLKRKPISLEARANMSRAQLGRKPSEETRLKMRRCTLNESAFSVVTPDSAYWIGYLIADGNVSIKKGGSVIALRIQVPDKDHLIKFRAFVGSSHKIGYYVSKARGDISYSIYFHSEKMAEDLARYGVVPSKCFTVKVKGGVENNKDLWRGVIDGDGNLGIYLRRGRDGSFRPLPYISLTSNLNVCLQFKVFLEESLGVPMPDPVPYKNSYLFSISDHRALRAITLLYTNCALALDRKLALARNIMNSFQLIGQSRCIFRGCKLLPNPKKFIIYMYGTLGFI
jgi:NUMOD3 motif